MEMMQETVTEAQVNEMLRLADLDKDGMINYEGVFCDYLSSSTALLRVIGHNLIILLLFQFVLQNLSSCCYDIIEEWNFRYLDIQLTQEINIIQFGWSTNFNFNDFSDENK